MQENSKTAGGLIFIMLAVYYLFIRYQGLAFIDSGELALCSYTLGVPHPTGYPLYLILSAPVAHIFSRPITGVTVLGSLLTALAGLVFFHLSASFRDRYFPAIDGKYLHTAALTLLLFIAPVIAAQGVTNEVYGLNLLVNLAVIFSVVKLLSEKDVVLKSRFLVLAWYLAGLSLCNHMSSIQLLPGLVVVTFIAMRKSYSIKTIVIAVGAFIGPLTLYTVLPIRALANPPPIANWGDLTSWDNFIRHISGWQYQVWAFTGNVNELWFNFKNFVAVIYHQFPVVILPLSVAGVFFLARRAGKILMFVLLTMAVNIGLGINYSIPDIDSYYLLTAVMLFLLAVVGLFYIVKFPKIKYSLTVVTVLLLVWQAAAVWDESYKGDYTLPEDYARNIMLSADSGGVILSELWDHHGQALYLQQAEGFRPDLRLIDKELLRRSWYYKEIENTYPDLYEKIADLVPPFLEEIEVFQSGGQFRPQVLEFHYQSIINRLLTQCGPGYIDYRLDYKPLGDHFIRPQGLLYKVDTIPIQRPLPRPELVWRGRGLDDYTDWRARDHVQMIKSMMQIPETGKYIE